MVEGPAHRVLYEAALELGGVNLPNLLDSDPVRLLCLALPQAVPLYQLLAARPPAALGKEGLARPELDAALERVLLAAVLGNPNVLCRHARHSAPLVQHLGRRKAGVDLHAEALRLLGEPPAELPEGDDVVAAVRVVEYLGEQEVGDSEGRGGARHEDKAVLGGLGLEGSLHLPPVGEELIERVRLEDVAGEDVAAHLPPLLDHTDAQLGPLLRSALL
mmetsp:Transcript_25018/g.63471  ORF Transcript_25018/g.63471 Transcript_25018/m.63471 type:complete len:218 (+) Transcript_25018:350-1003(+)